MTHITEKSKSSKIWNWIEKSCLVIVEWFFHLFHRELTENKYKAIMQFVRFGIVGLSNTFVSYVLYALSLIALKRTGVSENYDYLIAQVIQFTLSVLWSYYWNNRFVFKLGESEHRSLWKSLLKTYVSYSFTGLFLSSILLYFWVNVLHISEFIAPIFNLLVSVPLNFIINKFWAFKAD